MKAYGIACIALGALWGMRTNLSERRRRRRALSDLRAALARMSEEIRIARAPLPDLLARLGATCAPDAAGFFRAVSEGARNGGSPSALWSEASDALPLSAEDARTLRELAPVLRGDEEQIRKALKLASERLENSLRDFDKEAAAETRRTAALIFSAAALVVILLY